MIYMMSSKYIKRRIYDMVEYTDFMVMDAENFVSTATDNRNGSEMARTFLNRTHTLNALCPDSYLLEMIKEAQRPGGMVREDRYIQEVRLFVNGRPFIADVITTINAAIIGASSAEDYQSIFMVFPNLQYKYLNKVMHRKINELLGGIIPVHTQDVIERDMRVLERQLTNSEIRDLQRRTAELTREYDIVTTSRERYGYDEDYRGRYLNEY